jgi:hypothetical protein
LYNVANWVLITANRYSPNRSNYDPTYMERDPFGALKRKLGLAQRHAIDGPNTLGPENVTPVLPVEAIDPGGAPNNPGEKSVEISPAVAASLARAERRRLLAAEGKWLSEQARHLPYKDK